MRNLRSFSLFLVLAQLACTPTASRQEYPRVTSDHLAGMRYQPMASGAAAPRFDWVFTKERFRLQAGVDPIPPTLLEAILGPARIANKVEGRWSIDGGDLVLSDLNADEKALGGSVRLHVWNTGVIRVSLPTDVNVQYAFSRKRHEVLS